MLTKIKSMWQDEEGLTTVEYALLMALLVVAAITVWTTFGGKVKDSVSQSSNAFANTLGS
ncbi:MAG TPA: Flp family type IVb pilin [Armatimonadota bacterium]|jgi:Flp pilus assembly pilin Flp